MDEKTLLIIIVVCNIFIWILVYRWMRLYAEAFGNMSKKQMEYYHQASQLNAGLADELARSMNEFIEELREVKKEGDNGKISFKENRS